MRWVVGGRSCGGAEERTNGGAVKCCVAMCVVACVFLSMICIHRNPILRTQTPLRTLGSRASRPHSSTQSIQSDLHVLALRSQHRLALPPTALLTPHHRRRALSSVSPPSLPSHTLSLTHVTVLTESRPPQSAYSSPPAYLPASPSGSPTPPQYSLYVG